MTEKDDKIRSVFQRMKDKAKDVQTGVTEKISKASEAGWAKLKDATAEVDEILPAIRELGYSVDGIQIGVGLARQGPHRGDEVRHRGDHPRPAAQGQPKVH